MAPDSRPTLAPHLESLLLRPPRAMMHAPSSRRPDLVRALLVSLLLVQAPALAAQTPPDAGPLPTGRSMVQAEFDGTMLDLWVYKPANYVGDGFVLLLHGASRAAEDYRDNARGFADAYGRMVVVPEFDAERFPNRLYQMGGALRDDGSLADPDEQTFRYIPLLSGWIRERERDPGLSWVLVGYSAGAQFVSRMAAFLDVDAERLVAMSPGSAMFPTRDMDYGLGFGGLPEAWSTDEQIRRYLALPLTVAIGTHDVEEAQLPGGAAVQQGVHRYSRNLRWFNTAMDLAHERGWEFNWRLVLSDGAGHPPPEMFDHPQMGNALFGHRMEAALRPSP